MRVAGSGVIVLLCGYESVEWARYHNLILNRIAIINQIHMCRYDYAKGNPCSLVKSRGYYTATYDGEPLASWGNDLEKVRYAFELVDGFADCCWRLRRAGRLKYEDDV